MTEITSINTATEISYTDLKEALPNTTIQKLIKLTAHELSIRFYQDQGLTSLEISSMLNLSPLTISFCEMTLARKLELQQCTNLTLMDLMKEPEDNTFNYDEPVELETITAKTYMTPQYSSEVLYATPITEEVLD
jgi:hypothetical protein